MLLAAAAKAHPRRADHPGAVQQQVEKRPGIALRIDPDVGRVLAPGAGKAHGLKSAANGAGIVQVAVNQRPHLLLDVRLAAEYRLGHQPESLNLPVANLRTHADSLDRATCYVITPEGGIRSELAVHLLNQLGFDAYLLGDEHSAAA